MPITISHYQWMKETDNGIFSIRSTEMKSIDYSLLWYAKHTNQRNLLALRAAVEEWIHKEGSNWRKSGRNKTGLVEKLYDEVMQTPGAQTEAELAGVEAMREESRIFVRTILTGKQLDWRPGILAKLKTSKLTVVKEGFGLQGDLNDVTGNGLHRRIGSLVPSSGNSDNFATRFVKETVPADCLADVTMGLASHIPTFMKELAKAMTPYVGVITSGAGTLVGMCKTAREMYREREARRDRDRSLSIGDPNRAMEAVQTIIQKEAALNCAYSLVSAAECGGKLAGVAADLGTASTAAIGLGATFAKFSLFLLDMAADVKQRRKANEIMLGREPVNAKIFVECPILGAYFVCCAPHSVLTNMVFDRFFVTGWRSEVKRAVDQHIKPLQEQSRRLIKEHRFWIPALQNFQGMLPVNTKKIKEEQNRKGKPVMDTGGSHVQAVPQPA